MTPTSLIAMMVGRELQDLFPPRAGELGEIALEITHLKLTARAKPFSLSVRKGEIVALAGLEGQGQQKTLRSLIGEFAPFSGSITLNGKAQALPIAQETGVRRLQRLGAAFVPEDRKDEGLFLGLPIAHNLVMTLYSLRGELAVAKNYDEVIASTMKSMNIKAASVGDPVGSLSGGNQQKVLLGRYLAADVQILLIEEPTRGVDIGAKSEIYRLLREFSNRGGSVLVLSRETVELMGLCDRICVIHGDTLVSEMAAGDSTEHNILDAALSA
jgi:ribose transport system ATP-binding protein